MKRYNSYKDSGIEWIGKIPVSWQLKRIKHTTYVKGRIGWKGLRSDEFLEKSDSFVVTGTDFKKGRVAWKTCYQIPKERYDEDPFIQLREDDLLITKDGTIGKIAVVKDMPKIATLNSGVFVTRPKTDDYISEYLYWILESNVFKSFYNFNKSGSTIHHLYQNVFNEFKFTCPTLEEQINITKYLNYKTQQLDELIEKKENLIKLLEEERTAIINQAVTKGLNPDAPMKNSGIDWLGEIPEDWSFTKLKYLTCSIGTGTTPPTNNLEYFEPKEIDWFTPSDFGQLELYDSKRKISKKAIEEGKCKLIKSNSILLVSIGATLGKLGIILQDATSNQQINSITFNEKLIKPYFGLYFLNSIKNIIASKASSATLAILNQSQTKDIFIVVPNLNSQNEIVNHIKKHESRIKKTQGIILKEINFLKEYRESLISEVITGKVDVRKEVLS